MSGGAEAQGGGLRSLQQVEATNGAELLFFYRPAARSTRPAPATSSDTKASVLGDYIPAKLGMDEGEGAALHGGHPGLCGLHALLLPKTARRPRWT